MHDARASGIEAFEIRFSGTGGEYFRVWLVNLLLTVLTVGLYTPFARRRTAQYFLSHMVVAGSPLEFTARQRNMVFGFLVLLGLYAAFKLAAETGQDAAVLMFLVAGALLSPYLWGSAMRFRLASTRWRGVRLKFDASWGEVYRSSWPVFALAGAVAVAAVAARMSLGHPLMLLLVALGACVATVLCVIRLEFNYKSLLVRRARVGAQPGRWKPVYGDFVRIWLSTLAVLLAGAAIVGLVVGGLVGGWIATLGEVPKSRSAATIGIAIVAVLATLAGVLLAATPALAYRQARMFQLVWNNVGVSQIARFRCELSPWRFVRLRMFNLLLSLLTLGLWRPFAMVSEQRMKAESVTLHVKGGLDQLVAQVVQQQGAVGDAIADAIGLDLVG